jgi:hypothetical protein
LRGNRQPNYLIAFFNVSVLSGDRPLTPFPISD